MVVMLVNDMIYRHVVLSLKKLMQFIFLLLSFQLFAEAQMYYIGAFQKEAQSCEINAPAGNRTYILLMVDNRHSNECFILEKKLLSYKSSEKCYSLNSSSPHNSLQAGCLKGFKNYNIIPASQVAFGILWIDSRYQENIDIKTGILHYGTKAVPQYFASPQMIFYNPTRGLPFAFYNNPSPSGIIVPDSTGAWKQDFRSKDCNNYTEDIERTKLLLHVYSFFTENMDKDNITVYIAIGIRRQGPIVHEKLHKDEPCLKIDISSFLRMPDGAEYKTKTPTAVITQNAGFLRGFGSPFFLENSTTEELGILVTQIPAKYKDMLNNSSLLFNNNSYPVLNKIRSEDACYLLPSGVLAHDNTDFQIPCPTSTK